MKKNADLVITTLLVGTKLIIGKMRHEIKCRPSAIAMATASVYVYSWCTVASMCCVDDSCVSSCGQCDSEKPLIPASAHKHR